MRFILYIVALLGSTQLFAQAFSDSTFMDVGVQQPRSEVIVYDRAYVSEGQKVSSSRYVTHIDDWSHAFDNQRVFNSKFSRPFLWIGRRVFLRVRSASAPYTLSVNGVEVGRVMNCTSMAEFDISKATKEGRNTVTIILDKSSEVEHVEGWAKGSKPELGDVYVVSQPTQMIRDIAVSTTILSEELQAEFKVVVKCHALGERTSTIYYNLYDEDGKLVSFANKNITLNMRGEDTISFFAKIPKSNGWSSESPKLYTLKLKTLYEGRYLELHNYKVGIRSVEVDAQSAEMKINGERVTLTAKKVGAEFGAADIDALKAQGYNTIRVEAGCVNKELYDAADQKGLYIISPMPINSSKGEAEITKGGNPSNNPRWWGAYMQRVESGYHTVQMHPSVVGFSLADSSLNGYNLYEGYLRLKSKGDSRPVIYFEGGGEWNSDKLLIDIK
ncbi:MAG: glycoside hydrolase family 2 TIM barrel-domain containing protein [Rikenellaceae bacterium]